jgi:hypothetical protein
LVSALQYRLVGLSVFAKRSGVGSHGSLKRLFISAAGWSVGVVLILYPETCLVLAFVVLNYGGLIVLRLPQVKWHACERFAFDTGVFLRIAPQHN